MRYVCAELAVVDNRPALWWWPLVTKLNDLHHLYDHHHLQNLKDQHKVVSLVEQRQEKVVSLEERMLNV